MNTFVRALGNRSFALLWCGQTVSRLGDSFQHIALAWWVVEKTGSPTVMATMLACSIIPMLVFSLVGGAVVDRVPRLAVLVACDSLRGAAVGGMAALAWMGRLEIWHVYSVSAVLGLADALFYPAYRAVVPELVEPEALNTSNSLNELSGEISGLIGPALAGVLVAWGGSTLSLALNAGSFVFSGLCLLPVALAKRPSAIGRGGVSMLADVQAGLRTVFGAPWLWVTIGIAGISNLTYAGPMGVALPFLVNQRFQGDVRILGGFYTCMSVGALLAAAWLGTRAKLRRRGLTLYGAWMCIGLLVVSMAVPLPAILLLAAAAGIGMANTVLGLAWTSSLQELVPADKLGRVSSIDFLGSSLLEPIGLAVGGWALPVLGVTWLFALGGTLQTLLIGMGLLHPQVRAVD